jgi:voltage-gated potassium channel
MKRITRLAALEERLSFGFVTRMRMQWGRAYRMLRMAAWFPHVPLALLVGLAGLIQLLPSLGSLTRFISFVTVPTEELDGLSQGFDTLAIRGVSQELIGVLLIVLSLGLLLRSRLAWALTLLMTAATLGLQFVLHAAPHVSIVAYSGTLLVLLFLARRSFHRASLATGTMYAVIGIVLTIGYGVLGSYTFGSGFSPAISDFGSALYFTVVTMSTVGYGDITPHSTDARLFTVSLIVFGIMVFATSLTAVAGPLINQQMMHLLQPRKKRMIRKDHIIVVGDNPLALNAIKALTARGIQVTAIWNTRPPEGAEAPEDLIVGDGDNGDVLQSAGIAGARAVLALSEDDSENAFVALAAKDANEKVRTVVAVSNARNMGRVGHVRPDAVLALPVIGGELLAMALSGEEIKTDELLEQLLRLG